MILLRVTFMIANDYKTVWVTQLSRRQEMIWNLILASQSLSVFIHPPNIELKSAVGEGALKGQIPDLCLIDIMHFIRQKQSPYEFCRWCHLNYPEIQIILTHGTADQVSKAERLWATKQGAQDLLAGFQSVHLRAEITFGLQRVLEVLDLLPIEQQQLNSALAKIQKHISFESGHLPELAVY
ncbi:MAG: response regulator [Limnospira sp.]